MTFHSPTIARLSPFGLAIAATMTIVNVMMEVARKKAVAGRTLIPTTFWCLSVDTLVFALVWVCTRSSGSGFHIHGSGDLLGLRMSPTQVFVLCEVSDFLVTGLATWMFFKALQEAAMSGSVPFLAFTPVLLLPTGFLLLGELPTEAKLFGLLLTMTGSVMMHWRLFAESWLSPIKAIYRDKGSRYMLYTAMLLAISTPLDKKLSFMTDLYTQCLIYGVGMCAFFLAMARIRGEPLCPVLKLGVGWIVVAGILDAGTILLQYQAYQYIDAVMVISIKRSGIVLAVIFGRLFFGEKNIRDKLAAASMMFVGVLILYLPLTTAQAAATAAAAIAAMLLYMLLVPPGATADLATQRD
jgi:uncharacterized membrane protein